MSLKVSCQRFSSTEPDELRFLESLNDAKDLFKEFVKDPPTLEEALETASIKNVNSVLQDSMKLAMRAQADPEISSWVSQVMRQLPSLATHLSFPFYEKSPCWVINECLAGSRNRDTLLSARSLIFLSSEVSGSCPGSVCQLWRCYIVACRSRYLQHMKKPRDTSTMPEGRL